MSHTGKAKYGLRNLPRGMGANVRVQSQDIEDFSMPGARKINYRHLFIRPNHIPAAAAKTGAGGAPSGATGAVNILSFTGQGTLEQCILGAGQTVIVPLIASDGLLISGDAANNEGNEYCAGLLARSSGVFTVGTDPAFFMRAKIKIEDVSGTDDCAIGFRKNQAYTANLDDYTDFACINFQAGTVNIETALNNAATTTTDTTQDVVDGVTVEVKVLVSAAGVVTYQIDGVAPTVTAAFTFDDADVVTPFLYFLNDTDLTTVHLDYFESGFQAGSS